MPIRLVLADDHPIVLEGLRQLIALEPDLAVAGCARNGVEALELVRRERPDVLVLDIRMPGNDGLTVLRELARKELATRVVILTAADEGDVLDAIGLGAHGVVLKDMAPKLLIHCVREVHAGRRWLQGDYATQVVEKLVRRQAITEDIGQKLTPRELEVARLTAKGMHVRAIAETLSITEGTARLHLHHVYSKLEVDGRVELMQYLQSHGIA
jgi:two-component system nitrate/nitrite response regulator NarL